MQHEPRLFDPIALLSTLSSAHVDFVLVGGVAGAVHGSAYGTFDVDIVCDVDQPELLSARTTLNATLVHASQMCSTYDTKFGALDVMRNIPRLPAYPALKQCSTTVQIGKSIISVASIDHLIAMNEATGRTKDKLRSTEYRLLSDVLRA